MQISRQPLSPHLQIYRLPLTAVLSIIHRATGFFLSLGVVALIGWLVAVAQGGSVYTTMHACFVSLPGQSLLIAWSAMLYFHLCNGIRHLFWDAGRGFELRVVDISAWLALIATVVLTVLTWRSLWGVL